MKLIFGVIVLALFFVNLAAYSDPAQIQTTSWAGLTGLYITPTAFTLGANKVAFGFNESKHSEFRAGLKFSDRQIRGVATFGITDKLEFAATYYNDMFMIPVGYEPQIDNQSFTTFNLKLQVLQEDPHYWFPAVAIAVRDIFNDTRNVGVLKNVNNGTRVFLLASKRMLRDDRTGAYFDTHAGLSWEGNHGMGGTFGIQLAMSRDISFLAEGIYDAPYLNFTDYGTNNVRGRFLFNLGFRMYPQLVPGLVLDAGFVGDSEFEFSFGASYVAAL